MNVIFSTVDNGARAASPPYIHAHAGGVRIRFIERRDEQYVGWRCDEHGNGRCEHSDAVWEHLGSKIRDRIRRVA